MIKVNWQKIKKFEQKGFALPVIIILALFAVLLIICAGFMPLILKPVKFITCVFLVITIALKIHIESRMLQIYMILGLTDISFLFAAFVPVTAGLTMFFFGISLFSALLCILTTAVSGAFVKKDTSYDFVEPNRNSLFSGKNVMFFAPHEDDEINIYGGVIEQYIKNGSVVHIVFSTNGDFYGIGKIRIKEALKVAERYNISAENIIFLGYGDTLANKKGFHIYNCNDDEIIESHSGYTQTYAAGNKNPYKIHDFTRSNYYSDFKSVILEYKPDVLFCCDYDSHSDHRAASLFFEEAMGEILKENPFYKPKVYKGFAYSTAWNGAEDYYSLNARSTRLKTRLDNMEENGVYPWNGRIRFPVAKENLSRVMQNTSSYKAMAQYSSQTSTDHANSVLNSDRIFWERRTDSLLYGAKVISTSGNPSELIDFKLVSSNDIKNDSGLPLSSVWKADSQDSERIVAIKLPSVCRISAIALYESPASNSHIMNAVLKVGNFNCNTGELKSSGEATLFEFSPVKTDIIAVKIKSCIGECALLKIEAFENNEQQETEFIKIKNSEDDFCYDYIINKSGKEDFTVYSYPQNQNLKFEISSDNECVLCNLKGGVISVNCPAGEEANITVRLKEKPEIYDCIKISNPDERERNIISLKQNLELKIPSFAMQRDYYRGLLRRLAVYK